MLAEVKMQEIMPATNVLDDFLSEISDIQKTTRPAASGAHLSVKYRVWWNESDVLTRCTRCGMTVLDAQFDEHVLKNCTPPRASPPPTAVSGKASRGAPAPLLEAQVAPKNTPVTRGRARGRGRGRGRGVPASSRPLPREFSGTEAEPWNQETLFGYPPRAPRSSAMVKMPSRSAVSPAFGKRTNLSGHQRVSSAAVTEESSMSDLNDTMLDMEWLDELPSHGWPLGHGLLPQNSVLPGKVNANKSYCPTRVQWQARCRRSCMARRGRAAVAVLSQDLSKPLVRYEERPLKKVRTGVAGRHRQALLAPPVSSSSDQQQSKQYQFTYNDSPDSPLWDSPWSGLVLHSTGLDQGKVGGAQSMQGPLAAPISMVPARQLGQTMFPPPELSPITSSRFIPLASCNFPPITTRRVPTSTSRDLPIEMVPIGMDLPNGSPSWRTLPSVDMPSWPYPIEWDNGRYAIGGGVTGDTNDPQLEPGVGEFPFAMQFSDGDPSRPSRRYPVAEQMGDRPTCVGMAFQGLASAYSGPMGADIVPVGPIMYPSRSSMPLQGVQQGAVSQQPLSGTGVQSQMLQLPDSVQVGSSSAAAQRMAADFGTWLPIGPHTAPIGDPTWIPMGPTPVGPSCHPQQHMVRSPDALSAPTPGARIPWSENPELKKGANRVMDEIGVRVPVGLTSINGRGTSGARAREAERPSKKEPVPHMISPAVGKRVRLNVAPSS
eukprot:jgi/Botrbrau1/7733/Bobra.0159s0164.2